MLLLTGANGHLGANLLRRLLADGAAVRVLLRPGSDNSTVDGLDVERVFGDVRDPPSLARATRNCTGIYHCAAQISTVSGGERELFACNVVGTRNLLRAAMDNGVGRVVVSGSLSATGHRRDGPTDETVPFNPFERHLPYSASKAAVEHECLKAVADGLDVVIAVSCAILGPYDFKPSRMGRLLIAHAERRRGFYAPGGFEFVAARDIVEGHVLAMNKGKTGQKYIFSTEFMTMEALFELFREITGEPSRRIRLWTGLLIGLSTIAEFATRHLPPGWRPLLTPHAVRLLRMGRRADIGKAQRELGYRPTSVGDAVRQAYDWFAARGTIKRPRVGGVGARPATAAKRPGARGQAS